ncbi:NAD-dependent epimerase/dehydratase family protein [Natronolimnobius baerhuensis]|uniref:Epimerase n=1 Tax=Natronolimnobius baerhuensis TaxID=253108 RepID=A0A202EC62_9EURY|nr:NAD(P)-dependent oxidoreductase [Natronolimnobius baerhuensis]OVE85812.1 epimerase [Natronolimnobius baerhuensis]
MNVLVTGAYGRCGTAIIDHLHDRDDYEFTYLNRSDRDDSHPYGGYDTVLADVGDYNAIRPAFDGQDAVIHLAAYPETDGTWEQVHDPNIEGMHNVLKAADDAGVETMIFGSTNHVMGMYEEEHAPDIYQPGHGIALERTDPVRPDSYYGTTKAFGENLGRQYVENDSALERCYAIRICTVNSAAYDHPYGDAEEKADNDEFEHGSDEYDRNVARMKAMWQSRRDFAHQIDCCLQADLDGFEIFHGVSDNDRRWYSLEHARSLIGYTPQDNGEEWDEPPA